jgi:hypothetical protein
VRDQRVETGQVLAGLVRPDEQEVLAAERGDAECALRGVVVDRQVRVGENSASTRNGFSAHRKQGLSCGRSGRNVCQVKVFLAANGLEVSAVSLLELTHTFASGTTGQ